MNPEEERQRLYAETRTELLRRQLSNAENYDKAILSLATAALGFSLAFLKDIAPLGHAREVWFLKISWFLLALSIVSILSSFLLSQWGIEKQLEYAEKYYLDAQDAFFSKRNWPAKFTTCLNIASGIFFVLAIGVTIFFVTANMEGAISMPKDTAINSVRLKEGAPIPTMQKVTTAPEVEKGAPIPKLQPVRPTQTPAKPNPQDGTGGHAASDTSGGGIQ